jgi:peptide/nickel transport system substrate-binding protein
MSRLTSVRRVTHRPWRVARLRRVALGLAGVLGAWGCAGRDAPPADGTGGSDAATGGTAVIVLVGTPRTLLPALVRSEHEQPIVEVVYDRLADIGPALEVRDDRGFTPRLASAWQWAADSMSIAFTLDSAARWHDGAPLVADDVARTFALYTDPRVASHTAALLTNIDSVTVRDARTAVFWFRQRAPQQFYDAVHHMFVMPSHLLRDVDPAELAAAPLARAPVGTGRFRFVRWTTDGRIELLADTSNFRDRPSLDRAIFETIDQAGPALVRLLSGEADFVASMLAQSIPDASASPNVRLVTFPSLRYQLFTFNLTDRRDRRRPHPVLGDERVRRALTMATNVERMTRAVFDTIGAVAAGPIPRRALPDPAAIRLLPYDTSAARALLDSAGWRTGADGRRARNGVPLRLDILVPGVSENRQRMAVLLQDQWRAVGVELVVQQLEVDALIERLDGGAFDLVANGWSLSPGLVGLRQVWRTGAFENNYGHYANATVDAMVDSMLASFDPDRRDALITRVAQAIIDDAPALWLVEDVVLAGVHARLDIGTPSPLGWWHDLPRWSVRPGAQIARDRLGLGTTP